MKKSSSKHISSK